MWMEASLITYVAFGIPLVTGPYIVLQRRKIQWLPAFIEESNKLRFSVNDMVAQRHILAVEAARMERQVERMTAIDQRFEQVVSREGKNARIFRELVLEGAAVQREIERTRKSQDLLELFEVILNSDRDKDHKVNEEEINRLVTKVKLFARDTGKFINEASLRDNLRSTLSRRGVASTFNIVQGALSDEEEDGFVKLP